VAFLGLYEFIPRPDSWVIRARTRFGYLGSML
jgi:hypothetical protein